MKGEWWGLGVQHGDGVLEGDWGQVWEQGVMGLGAMADESGFD